MSKNYKIALTVTIIAGAISLIMEGIFIPKVKKLEEQEKAEQYTKFGYYNTQIQLNEKRAKKLQTYTSLAVIPILLTTLGAFSYWIPELVESKNKNGKPQQNK